MIDEAEICCPNAVLGCPFTFRRDALHTHLKVGMVTPFHLLCCVVFLQDIATHFAVSSF